MNTIDPDMKQIDPEKPFGTISGIVEGFPNALFSQNGRLYDGEGALIENAPVEQPNERVAIAAAERQRAKDALDASERRKLSGVPGAKNVRRVGKPVSPADKLKARLRPKT